MLIDRHPEVAVIAVDMPINLPGREVRDCDVQAKHRLGARASSVFFVPPIAVLEEDSYEMANDLSRKLTGRGVTQQAYALRAGVKEVGQLARSDKRMIEVHPELSFRELAGVELVFGKRTWNGQHHRLELLAKAGIHLPAEGFPGEAGAAGVDDVLDAAAAAWSAHRFAAGEAIPCPHAAKPGARQVIWS